MTMANLTVLALRVVLAVLLAGSVFVQTVMVSLLAIDLEDTELASYQRTSFVVISTDAFRYVHIVIGAIVTAAVLMFTLAAVLAPGESVPPGVILLMCGVVVAILGVALVVLVLRMLLDQAVARDVEATQMRAELEEVI
jgi:hypothetical protein